MLLCWYYATSWVPHTWELRYLGIPGNNIHFPFLGNKSLNILQHPGTLSMYLHMGLCSNYAMTSWLIVKFKVSAGRGWCEGGRKNLHTMKWTLKCENEDLSNALKVKRITVVHVWMKMLGTAALCDGDTSGWDSLCVCVCVWNIHYEREERWRQLIHVFVFILPVLVSSS